MSEATEAAADQGIDFSTDGLMDAAVEQGSLDAPEPVGDTPAVDEVPANDEVSADDTVPDPSQAEVSADEADAATDAPAVDAPLAAQPRVSDEPAVPTREELQAQIDALQEQMRRDEKPAEPDEADLLAEEQMTLAQNQMTFTQRMQARAQIERAIDQNPSEAAVGALEYMQLFNDGGQLYQAVINQWNQIDPTAATQFDTQVRIAASQQQMEQQQQAQAQQQQQAYQAEEQAIQRTNNVLNRFREQHPDIAEIQQAVGEVVAQVGIPTNASEEQIGLILTMAYNHVKGQTAQAQQTQAQQIVADQQQDALSQAQAETQNAELSVTKGDDMVSDAVLEAGNAVWEGIMGKNRGKRSFLLGD